MSSTARTLARPLRSLVAARPTLRTYATIPTKNPTPSGPMEPSREQAMPMGSFYEAILNTPQPIPDVKPEEPASTVKEHLQQQEAADAAPAKRGRKPKAAKTEPAATATAGSAPTASAAASPKATAKEAAAKSTVSPSSPDARVAAAAVSSPSAEASPPPLPTPTPPTSTSTQEQAKVIFGSRLAGPAERAERLAQIRSKSKVVAGVLVPPKPEEPDNCCMSGCVNCVWDRFRDEMEEWAVADAEAKQRVAAGETEAPAIQRQQQPVVDHTTLSMDDDGGGSETNWDVGVAPASRPSGKIAKDFWDEELYKNVPVGIREFMKQEKRLKEKHLREGTSGD